MKNKYKIYVKLSAQWPVIINFRSMMLGYTLLSQINTWVYLYLFNYITSFLRWRYLITILPEIISIYLCPLPCSLLYLWWFTSCANASRLQYPSASQTWIQVLPKSYFRDVLYFNNQRLFEVKAKSLSIWVGLTQAVERYQGRVQIFRSRNPISGPQCPLLPESSHTSWPWTANLPGRLHKVLS